MATNFQGDFLGNNLVKNNIIKKSIPYPFPKESIDLWNPDNMEVVIAIHPNSTTPSRVIQCAFKHKNPFNYRPQFKIWLSSNNNVNADVDDAAIWARLRVIEFPHSHVGSEDKHLKQRMKTDANLDAIFTWAVWGAVRWFMSESGLHVPQVVQQSTDEARDSVDYTQQFIDEATHQFDEPMPTQAKGELWAAFEGRLAEYAERKAAFEAKLKTAYITNADLYFEYKKWYDENGVTPKQKRSLSIALSGKGYATGYQARVEGKNNRGVLGLTSAVNPIFLDIKVSDS